MADKTELRMNLAAIKRVDPYAKDIADSSAHVAFYTFNSDENEWEKTDVEGVFFIYSRNAEPFHSIFINNRLNTNSFVEPITGHLELQSQPPFLLYRNERSRIRGFWFYNSLECDRIGELVSRLIKESESKMKILTKNPDTNVNKSSLNNINIFTMLSKAQEDFNNSQYQSTTSTTTTNNTTTTTTTNNTPPTTTTMKNVMDNRVSNNNTNTTTTANVVAATNLNSSSIINVASQNVMNFFASAKPAAASEVPLFQRLLSNPVSVEQIEKQQRAATPQECSGSGGNGGNGGKITPPNIINENGINSFQRVSSPKTTLLQSQSDINNTSPLAKFLATSSSNSTMIHKNSINESVELLQQKPLKQLLKKDSTTNALIGNTTPFQNTTTSNHIHNNNSVTTTKPALMPPTMFLSTSSSATVSSNNEFGNKMSISLRDTQQLNNSNSIFNNKPEPLTQTQLLQAMMYLIQNDPEFIKKLHEAYLKSFTDMVSL